jgi:hypothetical protein
MNIAKIREFWTVIEGIQAMTLLSLSDAELVQQVLMHLAHQSLANGEDIPVISAYIQAKIPLIRDLAHARLA